MGFQSLRNMSQERTWITRGNGQVHWNGEGEPQEERQPGPCTNTIISILYRASLEPSLSTTTSSTYSSASPSYLPLLTSGGHRAAGQPWTGIPVERTCSSLTNFSIYPSSCPLSCPSIHSSFNKYSWARTLYQALCKPLGMQPWPCDTKSLLSRSSHPSGGSSQVNGQLQ